MCALDSQFKLFSFGFDLLETVALKGQSLESFSFKDFIKCSTFFIMNKDYKDDNTSN